MKGGKREGAGRKPGQVSAAKRELADMAKDHAGAALETLASIAADGKAPPASRVAAAVAILDRAYGRPRPAPDMESAANAAPPGKVIYDVLEPDLAKLTTDELRQWRALHLKATAQDRADNAH